MKLFKILQMLFLIPILLTNPGYAKSGDKISNRIKPIEVELSDSAAIIIGGKKITLGHAIRMAIKKNHDVITGAYDVAMADSDYQRYLTKYSPFIGIEGSAKHIEYPIAMDPMIVGTERRSWDLSAVLSKRFSSGTTISSGLMHERAKTSDLEYGDPDYHRPILFFNIQQELLKNAFGHNERKELKLLTNVGKMKREGLVFQLSILVVGVIADYWTLVIKNTTLDNAELQLQETKAVRKIIAQNVRIGLAERFELNYYNALVASAEANVSKAKQEHRESLRNFQQVVDLDEDVSVTGSAVLSNKLPPLNEIETTHVAFNKRADYKIALLTVENAKLEVMIYENEASPSLIAELNVAPMGQRKEPSKAYSDTISMECPSFEAKVKLTYPLDNRDQEIKLRNARFKLKQANIKLKKYKRTIKDDIKNKIDNIRTSYELYEKSIAARIESEKYYRHLLTNLQRGRFSAAVVKDGLVALIGFRERELGTLVQYNVALLQLDIAKNELFEKYQIDIDKYIPKEE
ncbi:MAG: TolC family protein [Spirochaetota bacterium]|nr:TolC family protein [Spirochaetota bacterium]